MDAVEISKDYVSSQIETSKFKKRLQDDAKAKHRSPNFLYDNMRTINPKRRQIILQSSEFRRVLSVKDKSYEFVSIKNKRESLKLDEKLDGLQSILNSEQAKSRSALNTPRKKNRELRQSDYSSNYASVAFNMSHNFNTLEASMINSA